MSDLLPRYYFSNDFTAYQDLLNDCPHTEDTFLPRDILWDVGSEVDKIFFIRSGIIETYILHENGHRKVISFHGKGNLFPGFQQADFKIEKSIVMTAVTDVCTYSYKREVLYDFCKNNPAFLLQEMELMAAVINLLLYDAGHQRYNNLFLKLCNILYLLLLHSFSDSENVITITQENLADILGASRNHITKYLSQLNNEGILHTSRGQIIIDNLSKLMEYCSHETLCT